MSGLDSLQENTKRLLFKAVKVKPSLQWKSLETVDMKWRTFAKESCRDQADLAKEQGTHISETRGLVLCGIDDDNSTRTT